MSLQKLLGLISKYLSWRVNDGMVSVRYRKCSSEANLPTHFVLEQSNLSLFMVVSLHCEQEDEKNTLC